MAAGRGAGGDMLFGNMQLAYELLSHAAQGAAAD
jgi:hypothetical protein